MSITETTKPATRHNGHNGHAATADSQHAIRTTLLGANAAFTPSPKLRPFSVLMSLYHKERPEYLRQSLESVFTQTARAREVVLVKDGPLTPELDAVVAEYAARYPELKIVALPVNSGLGIALDAGLRQCTHELVARMDTDDIAKPNRFERQLQTFEDFPDLDLVNTWIDEFEDDPAHTVSTRRLPEFPFELYSYGRKRCPVNHPSVMFRRRSVLFAGSYRHCMMFEDYHLWVRLLLNGAKFYTIQESLLHFRASTDMYRRRGGLRYALSEVQLQRHMYRLGYIGLRRMAANIAVRFTTRMVPNSLRTFIYKRFLRR